MFEGCEGVCLFRWSLLAVVSANWSGRVWAVLLAGMVTGWWFFCFACSHVGVNRASGLLNRMGDFCLCLHFE